LFAGDDTLSGTAFNDDIAAGFNPGNDTFNGGDGDDALEDDLGNDTLNGGSGIDWLQGGRGTDTFDGGEGGDDTDTLSFNNAYFFQGGALGITANFSGSTQGGLASNRAIDPFGNVEAAINIEHVQGTMLADTVYGSNTEAFQFTGYKGNDTFVGSATFSDRIKYVGDEKEAQDSLNFLGLALPVAGITVNFASDTVAGNGASGTIIDSFGDTDTVSGVDEVLGTFFADTFNGGADNEVFSPLKGNDLVNGGGGFDVAHYASERVSNEVQSGSTSGITVDFSSDTTQDNTAVGTVVDGFGTVDQLTNIEAIAGSEFNDVMIGGVDRVDFWGNLGDDTLRGGSGSDYLEGGADNDTIYGDGVDEVQLPGVVDEARFFGARSNFIISDMGDGGYEVRDKRANAQGTDKVYGVERLVFDDGSILVSELSLKVDPIIRVGTKKSDTLTGDTGDDQLTGLTGNDTLNGLEGDDTLDLGDGNDTGNGGDGDDTILGGKGNDTANGGQGSDTLDLGDGNDTGRGGEGDDVILGGKGNDTISGDEGDDALVGNDGKDNLNGGEGDDELTGGLGNDSLTGGLGEDQFIFSGKVGKDIITDFEQGVDTIVLSGYGSFEDVASVIENGFKQVGNNVVLKVKEIGSVTFLNQQLSDFDESDFILI
jgi:Ca2+-binding RTX toxin-like protein